MKAYAIVDRINYEDDVVVADLGDGRLQIYQTEGVAKSRLIDNERVRAVEVTIIGDGAEDGEKEAEAKTCDGGMDGLVFSS